MKLSKTIVGYLILGLFLVSCTKKGDYLSQPIEGQVLGKWKLENVITYHGKDEDYRIDYKNFQNVTYEFKSNGHVTINGHGIDSTGIYSYQVEQKPYFPIDNDSSDIKQNILTCCGNKYSIEIGMESNNGGATDEYGNSFFMQLSNFNKGIVLRLARE